MGSFLSRNNSFKKKNDNDNHQLIVSSEENSLQLSKDTPDTRDTETRDQKSHDNCQSFINSNKSPLINTTMDVTKDNFIDLIQNLEKVIRECDYVAIDTELSGLRRGNCLNLFDTHSERYSKLKAAIEEYQLIQFGMSCFKRCDDAHDHCHYTVHSFNFYIFPQSSSSIPKAYCDRTFSVQSSSLSFLVNCGFDFNKLIKDGISYINFQEERQYRDSLKSQSETKAQSSFNSSVNSSLAVTPEDKKFVSDVLEMTKSFVADDERDTLKFEPCNAFRRKLIYDILSNQDFSDGLKVETVSVGDNSSERFISVKKVNAKDEELNREKTLMEAIGFSKVIQMLIEYEKPIVGHNALLDVMHTFNQFVEPLPKAYKEFKDAVHAIFPIIYDTKHIANAPKFNGMFQENSALNELHERFQKSPFEPVTVKLMNGDFEGRQLHEAGYDSYITGIVFANMVRNLGAEVTPRIVVYDPLLMAEHKNKLYIMYSLDIKYFTIDGDDIELNRDHIYHVTFPGDWKNNDLYHLFSAFGGVSIGWINNTSALCALKEIKQMVAVNKSLLQRKSSAIYSVISYNEFIGKTAKPENCDAPKEKKHRNRNRTRKVPVNDGPDPKKSKVIAPIIDKKLKDDAKDESIPVKVPKEKVFQESKEWD